MNQTQSSTTSASRSRRRCGGARWNRTASRWSTRGRRGYVGGTGTSRRRTGRFGGCWRRSKSVAPSTTARCAGYTSAGTADGVGSLSSGRRRSGLGTRRWTRRGVDRRTGRGRSARRARLSRGWRTSSDPARTVGGEPWSCERTRSFERRTRSAPRRRRGARRAARRRGGSRGRPRGGSARRWSPATRVGYPPPGGTDRDARQMDR
mmetsp:Transcript_13520/g.54621  ORF Transcript_13520/g.54621 Transcript_13520/m.54621 type:complete len:206 (-) Transcript_13520:347-964(-)